MLQIVFDLFNCMGGYVLSCICLCVCLCGCVMCMNALSFIEMVVHFEFSLMTKQTEYGAFMKLYSFW